MTADFQLRCSCKVPSLASFIWRNLKLESPRRTLLGPTNNSNGSHFSQLRPCVLRRAPRRRRGYGCRTAASHPGSGQEASHGHGEGSAGPGRLRVHGPCAHPCACDLCIDGQALSPGSEMALPRSLEAMTKGHRPVASWVLLSG